MPAHLPTPELRCRDLTCRRLALRQSSVNEQERTFEAVVATEQPAQVFDFRTFDVIDEVLLARGGEFPESVVMLDDHNRFEGVTNVVGSADSFRREGSQWIGRGRVSRPVEGNIARAQLWQDIVDGHLRAVSIGYQVRDFTDIPPNQSREVAGRQYKADNRTLRVTTDWIVRELSLTPIGADSNAVIRQQPAAGKRPKRRSYFA